MDLVLRKRICFNVYKRHSLTDKIRRKMGHTSTLSSLGVIYEIVSNIPKVRELPFRNSERDRPFSKWKRGNT